MEEIRVRYTADMAEYKKQMTDATVEVTNLDKAAAKVSDTTAKGAAAGAEHMKTFRQQVKDATIAYLELEKAQGANSKATQEAAAKVGELKGKMVEFQKLTESFNPHKKMIALKDSIELGARAFEGIIGVQALLGVKSEELEKTLVKVQAAMSVADSLSSLLNAGEAFKNLKSVIMTNVIPSLMSLKGALIATGVGAAAVALGLLIANWDAVSKAVKGFLGIAPSLQDTIEEETKAWEDQNKVIEENQKLQESHNSTLTGREKIKADVIKKGADEIIKLSQERDKKLLEIQNTGSKSFIEDTDKRKEEIAKINNRYGEMMSNAIIANTHDQQAVMDKFNKEDSEAAKKKYEEKKKRLDDERAWVDKARENQIEEDRKFREFQTTDEQERYQDALDEEHRLQKLHGDNRKEKRETDKQDAEDAKKLDKETASAKIKLATDVGSALVNITNTVTQLAGDNSEGAVVFSKAMALLNIGIATAVAYANATAAAVSGADVIASGGATIPAKMAAFYGIVAGNVASAIGIVASLAAPAAPKASTPKFKKGGFTGSGGNADNEGGFYAILHPYEYVVDREKTSAKNDEWKALDKSIMDYESLIYAKYVKPALIAQQKKIFSDNISNPMILQNNFDDSRIVSTLEKNKPATKDDISRLVKSVESYSREQSFLKRNTISR